MKFDVSPKMKAHATTLYEFPPKYEKYRLSGAAAEFTSGPFGFYLWQHIDNHLFTISEQRFWIGKRVRLYPNIDMHRIAINCMLAGEVPCVLRGKGKVTLKPDEYAMFYVPPGIMHLAYFNKGYYETIDFELNEEYVRFFIQDHPELGEIHDKLQRKDEDGMFLDFRGINMNIREQITKIRDSREDDPGRKTFLQNRINDILLQYLQDLKGPKVATRANIGRNEKLIHELAVYIRHNLDKQLQVKRLAADNNIHIATLEREFKKAHHKTVGEYILDLRLDGARELLVATDIPIYEIADRMGFTDVPHFSRTFKKRYNLSPTDYRCKWKPLLDKGLG